MRNWIASTLLFCTSLTCTGYAQQFQFMEEQGRSSPLQPTSATRQSLPVVADLTGNGNGVGRELFEVFRQNVGTADTGAGVVV